MNDIEELEARVTTLKRHIKNYEENDCLTDVYQQLVKECRAIENLLKERQSDKERIKDLEEKIKWKTDNTNKLIEVTNLYLNSIPKSLIKEKIEELNKEYKKLEETSDFIIADTIQPRIQVLEELLNKNVK